MRSPSEALQGVVAVLDALGASDFRDAEIQRFMNSRALVLQALDQKAESILGRLKAHMISTLTFNDTIIIVLKLDHVANLDDVDAFFTLLRKFFIESLRNGILFRGAIAIGSFYLDEETNTVMGESVTDAAAWYGKADWIGIHATPRASLLIDRLLEGQIKQRESVIVKYPVPMRDGSKPNLNAVNWPKGYFVRGLSPCEPGENRRAKFLDTLSQHRMPAGVEHKYTHTVAFYDSIIQQQELIGELGSSHPKKTGIKLKKG
jgi:hypothetical protein